MTPSAGARPCRLPWCLGAHGNRKEQYMSAPRKITSGHHIQFSSYINRLREGAARSKYGSRIACTDRFLGQCHRGWTGMLDAPPTGNQFRTVRIDRYRRLGCRWPDLYLPGWVGHRRLRRGSVGKRGGFAPVDRVRRSRSGCARHGNAVICSCSAGASHGIGIA